MTPVAENVTFWLNSRVACVDPKCGFSGWLIKQPHAQVVCKWCGGDVRPSSGDER